MWISMKWIAISVGLKSFEKMFSLRLYRWCHLESKQLAVLPTTISCIFSWDDRIMWAEFFIYDLHFPFWDNWNSVGKNLNLNHANYHSRTIAQNSVVLSQRQWYCSWFNPSAMILSSCIKISILFFHFVSFKVTRGMCM